MRVLVTGGCGFIGSTLVDRLVSENYIVDVVDDLSNGDLANLSCKFNAVPPSLLERYPKKAKEGEALVITGDFADPVVLSRINAGEYNTVYHLAANPSVSYSVNYPVESNEINLHKSVAVFKTAANAQTRVVFSSSCAVYGNPKALPTTEEHVKEPESPYGLQKLLCEQYLDLFHKLYGLDSISLRYFNVYGPRALGASPYSTAIAAWCNSIFDNKPLRSDGDGEQTRDMVHVDDVVEANFLAGKIKENLGAQKVNIATGNSYSNNQILEMIKSKVKNVNVVSAPERPGDVKHTLGDTSLASQILSFSSNVSLEEGLDKTIKWWRINDET